METTNIELVPQNEQHTILFDFQFINSSSNGNEEIEEYIRNGKTYFLTAEVKNGKKNGKGVMKDEDGGVIANLTYVEDEVSGLVVLRNDNYRVIFNGMMMNGVKQGKCIEYDENGRLTFHGFYDENGNPHKLFEECKGKGGYYYEYSASNGVLLSLSEYSKVGEIRDGLCYFYDENGKVVKVSHFSRGVEDRLFCTISEGEILREYDDKGNLIFESKLSKVNQVRINKEIDIRVLRGEELNSEMKDIHEWIYDGDNGKGFWIERLNGELISYSQYDGMPKKSGIVKEGDMNMNVNVNKNGISFDFENGECIRESVYVKGAIQYVKRTFDNHPTNSNLTNDKIGMKRMIENDDNGNRVYEGGYAGDYLSGFVREGVGKLYVNDEMIYDGHFHEGKREGYGMSFVNGYPHYRGEWHNDHAHGEGELLMNSEKKNEDGNVNDVLKCHWEYGYGYDKERNVYIDMNGNELRGCMGKSVLSRMRMMNGLNKWMNGKLVNNGLFISILLFVIVLLISYFYLLNTRKYLIISTCEEYKRLNWIDRYFVQYLVFDENCCNSSESPFELIGMKSLISSLNCRLSIFEKSLIFSKQFSTK